QAVLDQEVFSMHCIENLSASAIIRKTGLNKNRVYKILSTFAVENPELAEQMKKKGKDLVPEDYTRLQKELADLRKQLAKEKLRADFYEEMVAFGKDVYGIDLKKAGTK
ncbi:MAG: hypothetical protein MJZ10_14915, partial [Fibrobacter sp.]|nr:hypothetical protein [Fibrobacter sp.]